MIYNMIFKGKTKELKFMRGFDSNYYSTNPPATKTVSIQINQPGKYLICATGFTKSSSGSTVSYTNASISVTSGVTVIATAAGARLIQCDSAGESITCSATVQSLCCTIVGMWDYDYYPTITR